MEHNVDVLTDPTDKRRSRWYAASGLSSATLPLIMTDSGFLWTQAGQPAGFEESYGSMVDQSMQQPPLVAVEAWQRRLGLRDALRVRGTVTNTGTLTLGYDNLATLNVIVYEPVQVIHTKSTVRKAISVDISPDLEPGQSYAFDLNIEDLGRVNMSLVQAVVLVDYMPGYGSVRGFLSANAAKAGKDPLPPPTEGPRPTSTPTATPTKPPTAEPGPAAAAYLPIAKFRD